MAVFNSKLAGCKTSESVNNPSERQPPVNRYLIAMVTRALQSPAPLMELTLGLGQLFKTSACLILQVNADRESLACSIWHSPGPPQMGLVTAMSPSQIRDAGWKTDAVLEQLMASQMPEGGSWSPRIEALLSTAGIQLAWLREMETFLPIPVRNSDGWLGIALLMSASIEHDWSHDDSLLAAVADSLALAFQYSIQQQHLQKCQTNTDYLNHLKDDFLNTLNHELRTPLTSMMLAIRMLHRPDLTPDRAAMYLDILEQQCSREINLVNDLLLLQSMNKSSYHEKPDAQDSGLSPVPLKDVLSSVIDSQMADFVADRLRLQLDYVPSQVVVDAKADHLYRVLLEVITNARKFSVSGTTVTVTVTPGANPAEMVTVQISNVGPGIAAEEIPFIFDKFCRGRATTRNGIPGTGLGLALVKALIEQMGGVVGVSSQPMVIGKHWQTCFTLQLPKAISPDIARRS